MYQEDIEKRDRPEQPGGNSRKRLEEAGYNRGHNLSAGRIEFQAIPHSQVQVLT